MSNVLHKIIFCLAALIIVSILLLGVQWIRFLSTPLIPGDHAIEYTLKPGASIITFASDLHKKGLLHRPSYLIFLAKIENVSNKLEAGEYRFEPNSRPGQILDQIVEGKVVQHLITFVEGWTFEQLMAALDNNPHVKHTLKKKSPQEIMAKIDHPGEHPEGRFFPDTYYFKSGTKDTTLLRIAYMSMEKHLNNEWRRRALGLPYQSPYDALIVASIIEKEAKLASERPRVSGVIERRLQKGMPLQIDATVIYGLKQEYSGKLLRSDMTKNTPYNTYLHKGLVPTPIAMPGLASLVAALHPHSGTELYYVAQGDGSQKFSNDFTQHIAAVSQYRIKQERIAEQQLAQLPAGYLFCKQEIPTSCWMKQGPIFYPPYLMTSE